MGNSRSYALSQARTAIKEGLKDAGQKRLMLPSLGEGPEYWIPIELVDKRLQSPVRVTRKGVAKHKRRQVHSCHKAWRPSPPDWW